MSHTLLLCKKARLKKLSKRYLVMKCVTTNKQHEWNKSITCLMLYAFIPISGATGQASLSWWWPREVGGEDGCASSSCQSFVPSTRKPTMVSKKTPKCQLMMLHKIFLPPNLNIKRELSSVNPDCLVKKSIL
jgi:hypothetical protein